MTRIDFTEDFAENFDDGGVDIEPTRSALNKALGQAFEGWQYIPSTLNVLVRQVDPTTDTHEVEVQGHGVVGYADGPIDTQ